jgi:multidrug efflux pump subunit AcrB
VADLKVSVSDGTGGQRLVPLSSLVTIRVAASPTEINRRDLARQVTVSANLDDLPIGTATKHVEEAAKRINMPPGYSVNLSGEAEDMAESFGYMAEALLLAIIFVYLILAAQFESFVDPLIILFTVPLSMAGALAALYFTDNTLSIYSQVGLITLVGLITKHGILIVEFANQLQQRGNSKLEAVLEAATLRLRPILMTTGAMVLGTVPLALAHGAGAESRSQIGWVIVGGLSLGTVLTLFVIPAAYLLLAKRRQPTEAEAPALAETARA